VLATIRTADWARLKVLPTKKHLHLLHFCILELVFLLRHKDDFSFIKIKKEKRIRLTLGKKHFFAVDSFRITFCLLANVYATIEMHCSTDFCVR
jgi:hypothetical protein